MKSLGLSRHRVGDLGQSRALQRLAPALSALISPLIRTGKPVPDPRSAERAAHRLNVASATLAASVLMDSAVEHYRGSLKNPAMYTPLLTSAAALAVSLHGTADHRRATHVVRDSVFVITGTVGVIGTFFHLRNVSIKERGASVGRTCFTVYLWVRLLRSACPACWDIFLNVSAPRRLATRPPCMVSPPGASSAF
ncbi:MAG: hypothetical protein AAYR33_04425 [Acetobacteraceae bacterium]